MSAPTQEIRSASSMAALAPGKGVRAQPTLFSARIDAISYGLTLLLAFAIASFPARNSDVWLHLANGRMLAEGRTHFGVNPFAPKAEVNWVNSSWLFDLALYGTYLGVGGNGVVLLKALAVVGLAFTLSLFRPSMGRSDWSIVAALVAVVALAPYLLLRPALVSYLFFGLTLWLLWRPAPAKAVLDSWRGQLRRHAVLLLMFAVWADLDAGFLVGLLAVVLCWIGTATREAASDVGLPVLPAWLPLACVVVTALNPYQFDNLAAAFTDLMSGSTLDWQMLTHLRWNTTYLTATVSTAAFIFLALMLVGICSFAGNRWAAPRWRVLLWTAFAVLAAWKESFLPYFAIVTGMTLALNLQPGRPGRFVLVTAQVALVAVVSVSWMRDVFPWRLQPDSSLEQLAKQIKAWRFEGNFRHGDQIFVNDAQLIHYCAWNCPEEHLWTRKDIGSPGSTASAWLDAFNLWNITHCAVTDAESLSERLADPEHWSLVWAEGRTAFFRRIGPNLVAGKKPWTWDPLVEAFAATDASDDMPPPSVDVETAATYLRVFRESVLPRYQLKKSLAAYANVAGLFVVPGAGESPVMQAAWLENSKHDALEIDRALAALPMCAVQHCRRALAGSPRDSSAYLRLGQGYRALWELTRERADSRGNPLLADLRYMQMANALERAVQFDGDNATAHQMLADIYEEKGYLDIALTHRRQLLRLIAAPAPGQKPADLSQRTSRLSDELAALERLVAERRARLGARLAGETSDPVSRAEAALRIGLVDYALTEILLQSPSVLLGSKGLQMEFHLLLMLGRADALSPQMLDTQALEARANLGSFEVPVPPEPGAPRTYRLPAYAWLRLCWAAANGLSDIADSEADEMLKWVRAERSSQMGRLDRSLALAIAAEIGLGSRHDHFLPRSIATSARELVEISRSRTEAFIGDQPDCLTIAGLVALEDRRIDRARERFAEALDIAHRPKARGSDFATRPLAEVYLHRLKLGTSSFRN